MSRILIADLSLCLIKKQPLQTQQRPDHVFTDSLCLALGCSFDFTVGVETCVVPAEDLLNKGKADQLFSEQQGEDLVGEDFLDGLVMETTDMVKSTIRGCASFGHQHMDVGMKIDALSESLDHGHHSWHEHPAGGCMQKLHKCAYRTERE